MSAPAAAAPRELVEAQIRALIRGLSSGDPGGARRVTIASLYAELGMRAEASRWLLQAAAAAEEQGQLAVAVERAAGAVELNPENAAAHDALAHLRRRQPARH